VKFFLDSFVFFYIITIVISIFVGHFITKKINLLDLPGQRKIHKNSVPISGGISFIISFNIIFVVLLLNYIEYSYFLVTILTSINIIFIMGIIDDYINLDYKIRVLVSIVVYLFFISAPTVHSVLTIHNFLIDYIYLENFEIMFQLHYFHAFMFTIFCLLFFQFSTNMIDGINGLCLIYLLFINILLKTFKLEVFVISQINIFLILFILIYLILNIRGKSFLGDAGVYSLSFLTSIIILAHYKSQNIDFLDIIVFSLFPSLDLLRLFVRRLIAKKSPFLPDKNHLHHRVLYKVGYYKSLSIFIFIFGASCVYIFFNLEFKLLFILAISIIYFIIIYITKSNQKLN
jgi:UDP-GlcNAc:undecaprenyl-phosphate/decaprenyl-phosphate GlcNAc-1-phosphate transferase